jgi:hypothetical protein
VSLRQISEAWRHQFPGDALTKYVLVAFSDHACEFCGLTWIGMRFLIEKTGLGETRIQLSIKRLLERGLLEVHGYATGGRGRATEYVVLPGLPGLIPAPCLEHCVPLLKTPRAAGGIDISMTHKPPVTHGVLSKPPAVRSLNPPRRGPQPSVEPEPPRARAREADPPASPPGEAAPPSSDPQKPPTAQEARARADAMLREFRHHLEGETGHSGTADGKAKP